MGLWSSSAAKRRQLRGRQRFARAAERGEEDRVHAEDLPGNVAHGEVDIVQFAHPQFFGALVDLAEDLGQKRGQRVAVEVGGETAGHHQPVRQGNERAGHPLQRRRARDDLVGRRILGDELGPGRGAAS